MASAASVPSPFSERDTEVPPATVKAPTPPTPLFVEPGTVKEFEVPVVKKRLGKEPDPVAPRIREPEDPEIATIQVIEPELEDFTEEWVTANIPQDVLDDGPIFTVGEVGKIFFGQTPHWVRWRETSGALKLDGVELQFPRKHDAEVGARYYDLGIIEKMAHALAQNNAINGQALSGAILTIKGIARVYKLI